MGFGLAASPPMQQAGVPHRRFCPQCPRLVTGPFHSGAAHGGKSQRLPRVGLGSPHPPHHSIPTQTRDHLSPRRAGEGGKGPQASSSCSTKQSSKALNLAFASLPFPGVGAALGVPGCHHPSAQVPRELFRGLPRVLAVGGQMTRRRDEPQGARPSMLPE